MELVVKHFSELSAEELFEIYKLRVSVFVVEQKCPYQEVDDADRTAYHLWLEDGGGIEAYARVVPQGVLFPTAALGRVIAVRRRCGLGSRIVEAPLTRPRRSSMPIRSPSKRRPMPAHCMKDAAFARRRKNFWRMASRIYKCS